MARYTVKVESDGQTASMLVVLSSSQLCSALLDTIRSRLSTVAPKLGLNTNNEISISLHLDSVDGPMLDIEDLLSDVMPGAQGTIYAVCQLSQTKRHKTMSQARLLDRTGEQLQLRVVTPNLAQTHANTDLITPTPNPLALTTTLSELRLAVYKHLGLPSGDEEVHELDCNCSAARQIDANASLSEHGVGDLDALHTLVIVYGDNKVAVTPVLESTLASMKQAARHQLQEKVIGKLFHAIGGLVDNDPGYGGIERYSKLPILAICSHQSHLRQSTDHDTNFGTDSDTVIDDRGLTLDIHTSECPVEITAHNKDITIAAADLEDCAVDGVLTVFAVQRVYSTGTAYMSEDTRVGKAAIFHKQHAWEHPLGQSGRGFANLLSTLRVFTHIISGSNMEEEQQDAVLRILHLITRFPPAVRTAYVLMRGETPRLSECAALSQCLYEVLKSVVPPALIENDPTRFFEGTRLLFGLILGKAKNLRVSLTSEKATLPYTSMRVYDLRNAVTMLPVRGNSVQSRAGLLDAGLYEAFVEDGVLRWTNGNNTVRALSYDRTLSRVAIVSGGSTSKVVVYNAGTIKFTTRYPDGDISDVVASSEYKDLQYLAKMCIGNELGVLPPSGLPSASPPVLTLDHRGSLAVYVGRQGCGEAGRDILTFRPLVGEEAIDVSIITQQLVPILKRRKADGTSVFEAYGDQHRQVKNPDEILVICVDLSKSMDRRCVFFDIMESEDAYVSASRSTPSDTSSITDPTEDLGDERQALDELKDYLVTHESYEDFLAIVRTGIGEHHRLLNAGKVLEILTQLDQQQIDVETENLEKARCTATAYYYDKEASQIERDLSTLSKRVVRMERFAESLCEFLSYHAENCTTIQDLVSWQPGDVVPVTATQKSTPYAGPTFELPVEFTCPISSDLMEDPVLTSDNFTYERKNVERWFQTKRTSPLTNIVLNNLDVRVNAKIQQDIGAYVRGASILSRYNIHNSTLTRIVKIKSPLGSWSKALPEDLTLQDLYELTFRLTKGQYKKFELRHVNATLPFSKETLNAKIIPGNDVFIVPLHSSSTQSSTTTTEEMCLVKVYYDEEDEAPVWSYWECKNTTKTLASAIFRYYRARFSEDPSYTIEDPFEITHSMVDMGDGCYCGKFARHWTSMSSLFTNDVATGYLEAEPMKDAEIWSHTPGEPYVLKLALGVPDPDEIDEERKLSRLDVLKQMFDAFVNRLLAYDYQTHLGLVEFSDTPYLTQNITHDIESFRHKLHGLDALYDTAIWDGIAMASETLLQYSQKYPKARLRIICISDGEDNSSKRLVHDLASHLVQSKIVVDSFCIGHTYNENLRTLSYMTGGYKFQPDSLEEVMAICEMEPVLSLLERPDAVVPRTSSRHAGNALYRYQRAKKSLEVDSATRNNFPKRKELPQLAESFVELGQFARHVSSQIRSDSNLRLSRIHTEIRNCGAFVHPHYDIYICEPNFGLWKIVMQGPPDSIYAGGTFLLYVDMGEDYPMFPPKARFVTSIYHPNINRHGRICHSILDRNWTVDTTTKDVIDTIYSLLLVPEFSDPINTVVTLNYHWDEVQFKEEAQRHIQQHATKTRAEWQAEILA